MIRALFFDVDGTLVSFRTHRVPDSAREALLRAHARGVRLFVATGRTASNLTPLAGLPFDGVVALNGASCHTADGALIACRPIPPEAFERVMALSEELGFEVMLELDEGEFVARTSPAIEELFRLVDLPAPRVADLRERFSHGDCCQLCLFLDAETERRVMEQVPELIAARWHPAFADFNPRGVDKATGMRTFMERFGLAPDEVMAFGDGGNDTAMLRAAGIGVAMGNACAEAREAADHTTSSVDDDGILRALVRFGVIDEY
ncbi:Cof-type HAD-IIB family hydrolase [Alistipes sp.]|uniref:Cof-type HAD-IIB family hydrolase n=1 Tax=Alistipes sp. TaxID=1872444 RepID=UPI000E94F5FA|nr:Cof-type HAD-IIB family hydrolase [Alistipes sp.]HBX91083.1 HAD family hydrolase [Alistipes sp.]